MGEVSQTGVGSPSISVERERGPDGCVLLSIDMGAGPLPTIKLSSLEWATIVAQVADPDTMLNRGPSAEKLAEALRLHGGIVR